MIHDPNICTLRKKYYQHVTRTNSGGLVLNHLLTQSMVLRITKAVGYRLIEAHGLPILKGRLIEDDHNACRAFVLKCWPPWDSLKLRLPSFEELASKALSH